MAADDTGAARLGLRNAVGSTIHVSDDISRISLIKSHNNLVDQVNTNTGRTATNGAAITALQTATTVEGWNTAVYQNGWATFTDATYNTNIQYKKLPSGLVILHGIVKGNNRTGVGIFALPAGYRPLKQLVCIAIADDNFVRIDIDPAGLVSLPNGGTPGYLSLENISFFAEQ